MSCYTKPRPCLSKDSGHMSSGATDKIDFTQSSIDSLSSYDETDYICEQLSHCASFGVNGFLVSCATLSATNDNQIYFKPRERFLGLITLFLFQPTIFGTVASDLTPKDCSNRRVSVSQFNSHFHLTIVTRMCSNVIKSQHAALLKLLTATQIPSCV